MSDTTELISKSEAVDPDSPLKCCVCGYVLQKVVTAETGWQQLVCPNVGKNNSLGHTIVPLGYLQPIETTPTESGHRMNMDTALWMFRRQSRWLDEKLSEPDAKCGCGSCLLCAYRFFESLPSVQPATNAVDVRAAAEEVVKHVNQRSYDSVFAQASHSYNASLIQSITAIITKRIGTCGCAEKVEALRDEWQLEADKVVEGNSAPFALLRKGGIVDEILTILKGDGGTDANNE